MLSLAGLIVFGILIGVVAKLLMGRANAVAGLITVLLAIAGSLLGGCVGRTLDVSGVGDGAGFFLALLGAVSLLTLYRLAMRPAA